MNNRPPVPEHITHIEYFDHLLRERVNKSVIRGIADAADVVIQFEITDTADGVWNTLIERGMVTRVVKGAHESPTSVFVLESEVFLSILRRKMTLQQAFFKGSMGIKGDLRLALKMNELFSL